MHLFKLNLITVPSFLLAGVCLYWYAGTGEVALLLVGLVTFGMAYDFLNHIFGLVVPGAKQFLQDYSRLNFAALCFGIPFTALGASFVLAEGIGGPLSVSLVQHWHLILAASLLFGGLFLFARYKEVVIEGGVEFVLDKSHTYTRVIFIARRMLLLASLLIALTVVVDAWGTDWFVWSLAFTGVFLASIPLHILHQQVPSMLSEVITQLITVYGCWVVFVR